ncbi:unnamed protein product [Polarella glacialis]|uniref:Uncharacterized protein n=1 Tax=Polarella glacialis TaxID=89957 RepID=A0A813GCP0_POLGL|nr:unnamed protein product [Polarella glacialis]
MAGIDIGAEVYVDYGQGELHCRLITGYIQGSENMVCSLDSDHFPEQLDHSNPDLEAIRFPAGPGILPHGVDPNVVYGFGAMTAQARDAILREGERQTHMERAGRGLGAVAAALPIGAAAMPVPLPAPPLVVLPGLAAAAAEAGPGVVAAGQAFPEVPVAAVRIVGGAGAWILDEPGEEDEIGVEFVLPVGTVVLGSRALATIGNEVLVLKRLGPGVNVNDYARERRALLADDPRTLPGGLYVVRGFNEAMTDMVVENRPDWARSPVVGPRTAPWWIDALMVQNYGGLIARHHLWKSESGIGNNDRVGFEHEVISKTLEIAALYDGLNLKNCMFNEFLLRRLQLQEEAIAEDPTNPSYDGSAHWMGSSDRRGGALVAPALKAFVATELSREAAIMKEERKAREAKALVVGEAVEAADVAAQQAPQWIPRGPQAIVSLAAPGGFAFWQDSSIVILLYPLATSLGHFFVQPGLPRLSERREARWLSLLQRRSPGPDELRYHQLLRLRRDSFQCLRFSNGPIPVARFITK